jgi:hypothetical protein
MLGETAHKADPTETEAGGKHWFCDAAKMAVALAATALPFARSGSEEAERWLRILRVNGAVGNAMQALGMPEEPFLDGIEVPDDDPCRPGALGAVIEAAASNALGRGTEAIATEDLLVGVLATYGQTFENALAIRGTTPAEVLDLLAAPRVEP